MSKLLTFPDRRKEITQATLWVVRMDRGLRDAEREELVSWLEDPGNRDALLYVAELWDRADMLADLGELFPLRKNDAARRSNFVWLAAAAVVVLGTALTVFHYFNDVHFTQHYMTAIGEQKTVELPDHSKLLLNTATDLRVRFSPTERLIELNQGEANFEVAKNPSRPFTVRAGGIDIVAVGTAFNVRADATNGVSLTVTEGRVHVQKSAVPVSVLPVPVTPVPLRRDSPVRIQSEQLAEMDVVVGANSGVVIDPATERVSPLAQAEVNEAVAWQQGMIIFERTPLNQVTAEFNRYLTTPIVIADAKLADIRVSGFFRVGDIDGLSIALKKNFDIDLYKDNDVIRLSASQ